MSGLLITINDEGAFVEDLPARSIPKASYSQDPHLSGLR